MSLQGIPFNRLSEADIRLLLDGRVPESATLDYKQTSYGSSEKDKKEFRKDISAMANTLGGDLVIGIVEKDGFPFDLMPIKNDIDEELQRLEKLANSHVEPRIPNLIMKAIPIADGGHLIVVRVPRSFLAPHRIAKEDHTYFYARAGTTTYEPNVEQLRRMFTSTDLATEKIKAFHAERLKKIKDGLTPIPLNSAGKLVIHVVPLPAFINGTMTDLIAKLSHGTHVPVPPDDLRRLPSDLVNLDGFLKYAKPDTNGGSRSAYAQFFRNGVVEGVADLSTEDGAVSWFVGAHLVNLVVSTVRQYLNTVNHYDMGLPAYVFVSLCNAANIIFRYPVGGSFSVSGPIGRQVIALPEIYIDTFDTDVAKAMRPAFNVLWNAFGHYHCDAYDATGNIAQG